MPGKLLEQISCFSIQQPDTERPDELVVGATWCADGGSIVLASDEQLLALRSAVQPVFDLINQKPLNEEMIAAIQDLKANTVASPWAAACAPATDQLGTAPGVASAEWLTGMTPNGTWTVSLTPDDILGIGVLKTNAPSWAGFSSYTYEDGKGHFHGEFLDGFVLDCPFTYEVVGDFFRLSYVDLGGENYTCGTQLDENGL